VLRLVVGQGMIVAGAGVAAGVAVGLVSARAVRGLLFGIEPLDPPTFVAVPLLLLAVALVATLIPARRAARIDPVRTLGEG
jgi:putative ABC transport system permease protein